MRQISKPCSKSASAWLFQLLDRYPPKVAAIALANKIASVIWAMMPRGEVYRQQPDREPVPRVICPG